MVRKAILGILIVGGLGTFFYGSEAASRMKTAFSSFRESVTPEHSVEFEIKYAQDLAKKIEPAIRKQMSEVTDLKYEIKDLTAKINKDEETLANQKQLILQRYADLKSGDSEFQYASTSYSAGELQEDVEKRFALYQEAEADLALQKKLRDAKERQLTAKEERLEKLHRDQAEIKIQIADLKRRLIEVQTKEEASASSEEDTAVARSKKQLRKISKNLDNREGMVDLENRFSGLIPDDAEEKKNSLDAIPGYFGDEALPSTVKQDKDDPANVSADGAIRE